MRNKGFASSDSGFGLVGIMTLLVVFGIVGGTGYYISQKRGDSTTSSKTEATTKLAPVIKQTEQPKKPVALSERWLTYENKEKKTSFKYPNDWKLKEDADSQNYEISLEIESPDYIEPYGAGYPGTQEKGYKIRMYAQVHDGNDLLDRFDVPRTIPGDRSSAVAIDKVTQLTAASVLAYQYVGAYEGMQLVTVFVKGQTKYTVYYEYPSNSKTDRYFIDQKAYPINQEILRTLQVQ